MVLVAVSGLIALPKGQYPQKRQTVFKSLLVYSKMNRRYMGLPLPSQTHKQPF